MDRFGHWIGTATVAGSFVLSLAMFVSLLGRGEEERQVGQHLFTWFEVGGLDVGMDLLYDPLSALFLLLITGVGSLIHLYSVGYMEHDDRRRRFFGYLNLFVAAMLVLVLGANYLVVFLGWEGVGLASYLLIGFWQHKHSAAAAAKKAFVINRVGDIGLSLAVALMFTTFGTTDFAAISEQATTTPRRPRSTRSACCSCSPRAASPPRSRCRPGCSTRWRARPRSRPSSTRRPWSPPVSTSSCGPTSSSSSRRSRRPRWSSSRTVTLLWGAILGCAKDDIKKALAGSTMSQIGYMMLAAGLGVAGYPFAIFHLLTHGFFKANMFLGAGSVMHGMNDDVDMRHYGGLRKYMPVTFLTFAMGYLAIIGFPGFSGFWSKDKIIETALAENWIVGLCALLVPASPAST